MDLGRRNEPLPPGLTYDDLPLWMRKTHRELDTFFLLVTAVALSLILPLVFFKGLPATASAHRELIRTIEIADSIQAGIIYPRWAPDFNYGYGSPLWNTIAPLPHWLGGLHNVLAQTTPEISVKVVIALGILGGALGIFSFTRRRWGTWAAICAFSVYIASPQVAVVKPYVETDPGELLAVSFFFMALWAFDRVLIMGKPAETAVAALILGGLWVTQTPLNILYALLLLGWVVWSLTTGAAPRHHWRNAAIAFILGLGVSSFFLLPALIERNAVRWIPVTPFPTAPWLPISVRELLRVRQVADRSLVNPEPAMLVGLPVWGMYVAAVFSYVAWRWNQTSGPETPMSRGEAWQARLVQSARTMPAHHRDVVYFVCLAFVLFVAVTPVASPLWELVPRELSFYPRDLLLAVVGLGAIASGAFGIVLEAASHRYAVRAVGVGLFMIMVVVSLPGLVVYQWERGTEFRSVNDILREETNGYQVASFVDGWLLPSGIERLPSPAPQMVAAYQSGNLEKIVRDAVPRSVQVDTIEYSPQGLRMAITARQEFDLTMMILNFPGWHAELNNVPVTLASENETGFIRIHVPVGFYELTLYFGSTPVRNIAWAISGVSILLVGFLFFGASGGRRASTLARAEQTDDNRGTRRTDRVLLGMILVAVGLSTTSPRVFPQVFSVQSAPGVVEKAQTQLPRALQGGVDVLAYDARIDEVLRPGDNITLHVYWRAVQPDLPDYQVNLLLVDTDDPAHEIILAQHRHPGGIPVSRWLMWPLLKRYVRDSYYVRIPESVPPGNYLLIMQMGHCHQTNLEPCETIVPLFVHDGRGARLGTRVELPVLVTVQGSTLELQ